jgi:hypothetical protein
VYGIKDKFIKRSGKKTRMIESREDNFKADLTEMEWGVVELIHCVQNKGQCLWIVNMVTSVWVS